VSWSVPGGLGNSNSVHAGQAIVQFARSATEGSQKTYALKFESEKSIYRNSPIGKLLPMLAGLVEDGQLQDERGHPLPPCIIMERGESLNEWCQRRKPDIWGVMPVRLSFITCIDQRRQTQKRERVPSPVAYVADNVHLGIFTSRSSELRKKAFQLRLFRALLSASCFLSPFISNMPWL
jgi:hypothetical protein